MENNKKPIKLKWKNHLTDKAKFLPIKVDWGILFTIQDWDIFESKVLLINEEDFIKYNRPMSDSKILYKTGRVIISEKDIGKILGNHVIYCKQEDREKYLIVVKKQFIKNIDNKIKDLEEEIEKYNILKENYK